LGKAVQKEFDAQRKELQVVKADLSKIRDQPFQICGFPSVFTSNEIFDIVI
jgi:hypothetical protein